MKSYLKTYILIGLFFASLLTYWGLERAGVRTERERLVRESRILPGLLEVPESDVRKLEIEREGEGGRLVFERRGAGIGNWQMVEPKNAAAEPSRLETLVRNLKELRRSLDSGSVAGAPDSFGLSPAVATINVWGDVTGASGAKAAPIATLALGNTVRGNRYVRPGGAEQIEIADAKLLSAVDLPVSEWREQVVMSVPTFQVVSLSIKRRGQVMSAERDERGRWHLTAPVHAVANPAKIESLLSALSSLRVVDGEKGFVADDVTDFAPFGLATPEVTIELAANRPVKERLVLDIGKPVPDRPDRVYIRQGGQDDVVIVDSKALSEVPDNAVALRSKQVADIDPGVVSRIEIQASNDKFSLERRVREWELLAPRKEKADTTSVVSLLNRIDNLQTSEFFTPSRVSDSGLDRPVLTLKIWQKGRPQAPGAEPKETLALDLRMGKHDLLRKTVFARLEGDDAILGLPDTILEVLPKNTFAFRDLTMLTLNPGDIRKLIVKRGERIDEIEPITSGQPNRWRMRRPIDAPADTRSVTQIVAILSNLRADQVITDKPADGKPFGLDRPVLEVSWETDKVHRLEIGSPVPRTAAYYARLGDQPFVFTLKTEILKPLEAELRDHVVLTFSAARAQRVVLNWGWPPRTAVFKYRTQNAKGQPDWVDEPGTDAAGLDQSRLATLVKAMSQLEAYRFVQYDGEIQPYTGLLHPRLTVEVVLSPPEPTRTLRIGAPTGDGNVFAAEGTSSAGPVFLLPVAAWQALIESGERFDPLPANVFAPVH
jgi:Domain of unknown function (DUF4340)